MRICAGQVFNATLVRKTFAGSNFMQHYVLQVIPVLPETGLIVIF